jgi:hypothetical protein
MKLLYWLSAVTFSMNFSDKEEGGGPLLEVVSRYVDLLVLLLRN